LRGFNVPSRAAFAASASGPKCAVPEARCLGGWCFALVVCQGRGEIERTEFYFAKSASDALCRLRPQGPIPRKDAADCTRMRKPKQANAYRKP